MKTSSLLLQGSSHSTIALILSGSAETPFDDTITQENNLICK